MCIRDRCSISACGDSLQETGRRIRQIPIKGETDRIVLGYVKRKRNELTAEAEKMCIRDRNMMRALGVVTLPITDNQRLQGLITIGDIANAYMDV